MVGEHTDDPLNYTEIDVSPANGLWAGLVLSPLACVGALTLSAHPRSHLQPDGPSPQHHNPD